MNNDVVFDSLKQILTGAGITLLITLFGKILLFFFKLFTAHFYGPSNYGIFELLSTIFGIALIFGHLGFIFGIQRYVSYYLSQKKYFLFMAYKRFIITIVFIFSFLTAFFLFFLSDNITSFFHFPQDLSFFLKIVAIGIIFRNIMTVYSQILLANKKTFFSMIGYRFVEPFILVVGVFFFHYFHFPFHLIIIIFLFSLFFSFLITFFFYYKFRIKIPSTGKKTISYHLIKEWFNYSYPLLFSGFFAYLLSWTDNLVIGKTLDAYSLGIYGVAYSLSVLLVTFSAVLNTLFLPVMTPLYYSHQKEFALILEHLKKWNVIGSFFLGGIFLFFPRPLILFLFGRDYLSAIPSLMILSIFFLLGSFFVFNGNVILIVKRTKFFLWSSLVMVFINLFLNVLLIRLYGIFGVAFASGLSYFLMRIIETFYASNYVNIKKVNFSILKKFILVFSFFYAFLKLFLFYFSYGFVSYVLIFFFYCVFFVLSLFIFKLFNKNDILFMRLIEKRLNLNLTFIKRIILKLL